MLIRISKFSDNSMLDMSYIKATQFPYIFFPLRVWVPPTFLMNNWSLRTPSFWHQRRIIATSAPLHQHMELPVTTFLSFFLSLNLKSFPHFCTGILKITNMAQTVALHLGCINLMMNREPQCWNLLTSRECLIWGILSYEMRWSTICLPNEFLLGWLQPSLF